MTTAWQTTSGLGAVYRKRIKRKEIPYPPNENAGPLVPCPFTGPALFGGKGILDEESSAAPRYATRSAPQGKVLILTECGPRKKKRINVSLFWPSLCDRKCFSAKRPVQPSGGVLAAQKSISSFFFYFSVRTHGHLFLCLMAVCAHEKERKKAISRAGPTNDQRSPRSGLLAPQLRDCTVTPFPKSAKRLISLLSRTRLGLPLRGDLGSVLDKEIIIAALVIRR